MSSDAPSSPSSPVATGDLNLDKVISTAVEKIVHSSLRSPKRPKRKREEKENMSPEELSFQEYGRMYARLGEIFVHPRIMADTGIRYDTADSDEDSVISKSDEQRRDGWNILCAMIPNFRTDMIALHSARTPFKKIFSLIEEGITHTRSDDTSTLKHKILLYLTVDNTIPIEPPFAVVSSKSDRGWAHAVTARLLCPIAHPATQLTYDKIQAGAILVTAESFPRFLYPDDRVENPEDIETGLLKGHVLLRVAKHILQGPSAALERPGFHRGKRGKAALMGITSVTPRLIAYLAVQTRFGMTQASSWSANDTHFDYSVFYWEIVGLFDGGEGADIIEYFNFHIFGSGTPPKSILADTTSTKPLSDLDRLKAQRAAKRARLAEAAGLPGISEIGDGGHV